MLSMESSAAEASGTEVPVAMEFAGTARRRFRLADPRRSAADRRQHRQAAGVVAQALVGRLTAIFLLLPLFGKQIDYLSSV